MKMSLASNLVERRVLKHASLSSERQLKGEANMISLQSTDPNIKFS